jgi:hypothetical protein
VLTSLLTDTLRKPELQEPGWASAGGLVVTGRVQVTKGLQARHAEHRLIIRDQALAAQYMRNWQERAQHSQPYVGRGVR